MRVWGFLLLANWPCYVPSLDQLALACRRSRKAATSSSACGTCITRKSCGTGLMTSCPTGVHAGRGESKLQGVSGGQVRRQDMAGVAEETGEGERRGSQQHGHIPIP